MIQRCQHPLIHVDSTCSLARVDTHLLARVDSPSVLSAAGVRTASSGPTAAQYPVHAASLQFQHYLTDMGWLGFELVDRVKRGTVAD